jgi:hypothetical protein
MTTALQTRPRKIILHNYQSPGDVMMLTATVRDLHAAYPGKFLTGVDTSCKELWENNPLVTKLDKKDPEVEIIKCQDYQLINRANQTPHHFLHCFHEFLENKLNLRIPATKFKADLYISKQEKSWISQIEEMGIKDDFWIVNAGGKLDYTAKWFNPDFIQQVIDHYWGKITFVQVGEESHWHPKLKRVVNLIGKTNIRQFLRLVFIQLECYAV